MSRYFGRAVHSAYVVPNINDAIARMHHSGIGPAYLMDHIRVAGRYRGERNDVLISAAFVYTGSLQFEFIEQHDDTPSAYREFLARNPLGGFHHTAYISTNFEASLKQAAEAGQAFDVVQEFIGEDGTPYEIYVEPKNSPEPLLMQLLHPGPLESFFDEMEKTANSWDGKTPIRDALALLPAEMRPPVEKP